MRIADVLLIDFDEEIRATHRLFERVPADKGDWKPHERSMPLGKLAMHVATLPGFGALVLGTPYFDMSQGRLPAAPFESAEKLSATLDDSAAKLRALLDGLSDEDLQQNWQLRFKDRVFVDNSRIGAYKAMFFNHFIHHRAQLTVYLRLLDIPIPGLYGPSADEPISLV